MNGAVATKTLADLRRRRGQSAGLALALFLSAGAATVALGVLDASNAPFDRAFAAANGAHLVVDYHGGLDPAALRATIDQSPVTASAGPWPVTLAAFESKGGTTGNRELSGRPAPDGTIDAITILEGRWWTRPGELVIDQDTATLFGWAVGTRVGLIPQPETSAGGKGPGPGAVSAAPGDMPGAPGSDTPAVTATVVGIAASVSTPDVAGWMSPVDVASVAGGSAPRWQMLYRVDPSAEPADLAAAMTAIAAGLPADAVASVTTYLEAKASVANLATLYVPVLLAFAAFVLLAATFTIANIVSGATLTRVREIGVMKAIGYTPAGVTAVLLGNVLVPVVAGAAAGVVAGLVLGHDTVDRMAQSFGLPGATSVSSWVPAVAFFAAVAAATVASMVPAVRAGRLSAVAALTRAGVPGSRPDAGRLRRFGLRLPAPLAVRLGVSAGVAHRGRAAMTLGALAVGTAGITFAVALNLSLLRVQDLTDRETPSPVRVELPGGSPATVAEVASALGAQPGTGRSVAFADATVGTPALGSVEFVGYDGDASWIGYALISGRWFAGPGEVVAPTAVFADGGLRLGDEIQVASGGRSRTVRLVGEFFDTNRDPGDDHVLRGALADLVALDPSVTPTGWEIRPEAGIDPAAYGDGLRTALGGGVAVITFEDREADADFLVYLSVVALMGAVLAIVSLGGVFDTVALETRRRARELAVYRAIGMTPGGVVVVVIASIVPIGILAGLLGVPLGLALQRAVLGYLGHAAANTAIPPEVNDVLSPAALGVLALTALAIAVAGSWVPAWRAARSRMAVALQAE